MKRIARLLIISLITTVALTGCWGGQNNDSNKKDDTKKTTSEDFAYKNTKYGFSMTIPKNWEKYKVESVKTDLPAKATDKLVFKISDEEVFNITVYPVAEWTAVKAAADGPLPTEITSDAQFTYTYSVNQGVQSENGKKAMSEVESVVKTFAVKK